MVDKNHPCAPHGTPLDLENPDISTNPGSAEHLEVYINGMGHADGELSEAQLKALAKTIETFYKAEVPTAGHVHAHGADATPADNATPLAFHSTPWIRIIP